MDYTKAHGIVTNVDAVTEAIRYFMENHPWFAIEKKSDKELDDAITKMTREDKIKFLRERN